MSKLSKSSALMRKKWEDAAIAKGGKDAKIIISQGEVQPIVFNLLRDSFRPMNITSIYEDLKAVVPPPVLKTCLEAISAGNQSQGSDFSGDDDDDDDDKIAKKSKKKKSKKDKTKTVENASTKNPSDQQQKVVSSSSPIDDDSVQVKNGRNTNTTLYYCNQKKLENDGNGLIPEDRHKLMATKQETAGKLEALSKSAKSLEQQTAMLLSQPTNEELEKLILQKESELSSLESKVDEAKSYAGNKQRVKVLKRNIDRMASEWRKRKRKCIDFLEMIEDSTEGMISKKKCLAGSGQIELESDEAIIQQAREMFNNKKQRTTSKSSPVPRRVVRTLNKANATTSAGVDKVVEPSSKFIGVKLGTSLTSNIIRVYANE